MQRLIVPVLLSLVVVSTVVFYGSRLLTAAERQEGEKQNTSPEQQQSPQASQTHGSSSASVQSVTGCLVQTNSGYSLKTESDTYPIETNRDLSKYVNKQIKVTGILEHHNAGAPSTENSNAIAMTDLRLRLVASVVGECKQ